jgi:predicted nucleotidyltransferase
MATLAEASLADAERRTLERLVDVLRQELGSELRAVWLFGSRARGDNPHEESDVDLIVLTKEGGAHDQGRVIDLLFDAADAEGAAPTYFSAHVRDPEWVAERRAIDDFFIREVDRDKIVLFGKP